MTSIEKAKELIEQFTFSCRECDNAKLSALIAVDEIIKALETYDEINNTFELQNMDSDFRYWERVKQEIYKQ
jgi:hypothetical protein